MPVVKVDVSDVTEEDAEAWGGAFESPKPGVYRFKILECNPGFSRGDDGEPSRSKPRLEVVYECTDKRYKGARVWEYIPLVGHEDFGESSKKKMLQLLLATGLPKKDFDPKKIVGKVTRVRVRGGKDQSGEYRGEFGAVFKDSDDKVKLTEGAEDAPADEELLSDDETLTDDESETLTDDTAEGEGFDEDARRAELSQMAGEDLKTIAREWKEAGWEITIGGTKSALVDKILAVEAEAAAAGLEAEEEVVEDEELIEDEELVEDEADFLTEEQLRAMPNDELKATAKQFDVAFKGTKGGVISAILKAQGAPAPAGDADEPPF